MTQVLQTCISKSYDVWQAVQNEILVKFNNIDNFTSLVFNMVSNKINSHYDNMFIRL